MAITAVMVDRARIVSSASSGVKLEGTTRLATVYGEWFRARLFLEGAQEVTDVARGNVRTVSSPQVLFNVKDVTGLPVLVNADQRIEIRSNELGNALWEVTEDPQPIRKKRRVIGFLGTLRRVDEHPVAL